MNRRWLVAGLLAIGVLGDVHANAGSKVLPAGFLGTWKGKLGYQAGGMKDVESATVTFFPGKVGATVGTITLHKTKCTASLRLTMVGDDAIGVDEKVTSGPCFGSSSTFRLSGAQLRYSASVAGAKFAGIFTQ